MKRKLLIFIAVVATSFAVGYGASAKAWPVHGRDPNRGYFTNTLDYYGDDVLPVSCSGDYNYWNGNTWCNALPRSLNSASELISFVISRANDNDNDRATTGARFILHTVIGSDIGERSRPPTSVQYQRFRDAINNAAAEGRISWNSNYNFNINSYWQGSGSGTNPRDDAFYNNSGDGYSIIIRNTTGNPYVIRRECANPVGNGTVTYVKEWTMSGRSTATNETSASRGDRPFAGDRIRFRHYVRNLGPTDTDRSIWFAVLNHPSNTVLQGNQNSGTYEAGQEKLVDSDEVVTIPLGTPPGTQICRKVRYDWANSDGARNGVGLPACVTVVAEFDLEPFIDLLITDPSGQPVTGNSAQPGDTVRFRYRVVNSMNGASDGTNCTIYGMSRTGYFNTPAPPSDPGFSQPAHGCPRDFPGNQTTELVIETLPANVVVTNRSICRILSVTPADRTGRTATAESCVHIVNKPYARVFGGDVSAGGGLAVSPDEPNSCNQNTAAAVIGWNRRAGGGYAGAGVQFATYALSAIFDMSTSLGNSGGAPPPASLSFANDNTSLASGRFGGDFGLVSCVPNYYDARPASATGLPAAASVNGMGSGSYIRQGDLQLNAGTVNAGSRVTIYVNGDLFIAANTVYAGAWSVDAMPMLRLVVRGDIFIDNDVTQLDGLYIAQPRSDGSRGIIHTCALSPAVLVPDGSLNSRCNKKLTINGSFAARQIRFLRTNGTFNQSNAADGSGAPHIAEAFNYTPIMWVAQPTDTGNDAQYDSITSLPPIL